jgi:hypothetical protein
MVDSTLDCLLRMSLEKERSNIDLDLAFRLWFGAKRRRIGQAGLTEMGQDMAAALSSRQHETPC